MNYFASLMASSLFVSFSIARNVNAYNRIKNKNNRSSSQRLFLALHFFFKDDIWILVVEPVHGKLVFKQEDRLIIAILHQQVTA